jgi:hypothetical protein
MRHSKVESISGLRTQVKRSLDILAELNIPVGQINEMLPTIVLIEREVNLHERPPLGPLGLTNQMHPGFLGRAIGLQRVALNARANNVLPGCGTTPIPRDYVIQVEVLPITGLAAILAGILVALENIVPGEFHFLLRKVIVNQQKDHPWKAQSETDGPNRLRMGLVLGQILPLGEVEGLKRAIRPVEHNMGVALEQQRQGATCRADIDRLPKTV